MPKIIFREDDCYVIDLEAQGAIHAGNSDAFYFKVCFAKSAWMFFGNILSK